MDLLAMVNAGDPVFWAVVVGWVMSVVLHELAHGAVAYAGGDYTIRERGGLTLNPLQYIHPVNSILLPIVLLLMGGVPLPGGVTYVRRDLLRSATWDTAVSLAGPAVNFALFGLMVLPLHPRLGWVHPPLDGQPWTNGQQFLAAMATLQFITGLFNLIPVPPLDGFGAIGPALPADLRARLSTPQAATIGMLVLFGALWTIPHAFQPLYDLQDDLLGRMGMPRSLIGGMARAYNAVLFGM